MDRIGLFLGLPLPDLYVTAYRERDLSVFEFTFFENSLKINLGSKNYNNGSEVALIYELQFEPVIIIFRTKIDF